MRKEYINISVRQMCFTALMIAFVFLMTLIPRVPIPLGYAHLGDAAIFLVLTFVGKREGLLAGCLGSALADFISGFAIWILPTLVVKWAMAYVFWFLALRNKKYNKFKLQTILAIILASLVMVFGYTLFGAFLYNSIAVGMTSALPLIVEGIVNIIAFFVLEKVFKRIISKR